MEQRRGLLASGHRARGELQQWRVAAAHAIAHGRAGRELLLLRPRHMGVDVELVGDFGEDVDVADGDSAGQKWLEGRLTPEPSALPAPGEAPLETGRDLGGIV